VPEDASLSPRRSLPLYFVPNCELVSMHKLTLPPRARLGATAYYELARHLIQVWVREGEGI
jgi:hypothetical protein